MKKFLQKALALVLTLSLTVPLAATAGASPALGDDLTNRDTLLNEQTQLSTNVFWSTSYSDLRTENLITYTPNPRVKPIVTFGSALTDRSTVSRTAKALESQGMRVVAGINGDFYNTGTGLPIGITVSKGKLLSSDGGYHAIGFRRDGTAIIGRPQLTVNLDTGFTGQDEFGNTIPVVRKIAGVNKSRVSEGGIFLYTYEFNGKHTTGTTEPGLDIICTVESGQLAIGQSATLRVQEVRDNSSATPIAPEQVVLSVNLKSDPFYVDTLRKLAPGSTVTVTASAADPGWNDVEFAVGALYALVQNGAIAPGLEKNMAPRTAVGQRPDGSLLFYTIDGRRSGHSIGASMAQVAERMIELGCVSALCLDGGGSTTLTVTSPAATEAKLVNRPSGAERSVTNQVFLVADNTPSGVLSHFFVQPEHSQVLAGSSVNISASAVDTNYIPMNQPFALTTDIGVLNENVLTTPRSGGIITVTAANGGSQGTATVEAIPNPDEIAIRLHDNIIKELRVVPGSATTLTASAAYKHRPLYANAGAFDWSFTGNCGTVDPATGVFTASQPGSGTLTVSAGGRTASVPVTVTRVPLKTAEGFEGDFTLSKGYGDGITLSSTATGDPVRFGKKAMKMTYALAPASGYSAHWNLMDPMYISGPYTTLNFWVYGDGSANTLELLTIDSSGQTHTALSIVLDFTGWRQLTVPNWNENTALQGFRVTAPQNGLPMLDENGMEIAGTGTSTPTVPSGTLYFDQFVGAFPGAVDTQVPKVTIKGLEKGTSSLVARVEDDSDGFLPRDGVHVTLDGSAVAFHYDEKSGKIVVPLTTDGLSHRVTITAMDGSGNLGRAIIENFKFSGNGFRMLAAFDVDPAVVGTEIAGVPVYHADSLEDFIRDNPVSVGMLTVPISAAQEMGDRLVAAGVKGIWNFTNYEISFQKDEVVVESVHFSDSLLTLSYLISQREIQDQEPLDQKEEKKQ